MHHSGEGGGVPAMGPEIRVMRREGAGARKSKIEYEKTGDGMEKTITQQTKQEISYILDTIPISQTRPPH